MPIFSTPILQILHWAARKGLRDSEARLSGTKKLAARRTGIRGETYAYWYLRRHGYVFVASNFTPRASKGELDMVTMATRWPSSKSALERFVTK